MGAVGDALRDALARFEPASVLDILAIAVLIYLALVLLRGTVAITLLRGVVILVVAMLILAQVLDLTVLQFVLRNALPAVLIALAIVFQPELRRFLERLGRTGLWLRPPRHAYDQTVDAVVQAAIELARRRHGALIALERETGLEDYAETGVKLDALVSRELLMGIFYPNSPLHDGATIVRGNRVVAAGCTLPLSQRLEGESAGLRHRAALGLAEATDAVCVVVSEEAGQVSVAANGRILWGLDERQLRAVLRSILAPPEPGLRPVRPL
ncbi:Cyclic di-AMP synthase CdaA [bacterium HR24]|jgi:diadenylate cyclase|nr:Cyclic di-AMP synthase CdaA [bacterium HR24]